MSEQTLFEIQIQPEEGWHISADDPTKHRYWRVKYRDAFGANRRWTQFLVERPNNVTVATLQEMCAKHVQFKERDGA